MSGHLHSRLVPFADSGYTSLLTLSLVVRFFESNSGRFGARQGRSPHVRRPVQVFHSIQGVANCPWSRESRGEKPSGENLLGTPTPSPLQLKV